MIAGNKEQSEILEFSLCFHSKMKMIIYYNSQNAASTTTTFNINLLTIATYFFHSKYILP